MTLQNHYALCYAYCVVLWLNGNSEKVGDGTLNRAMTSFYRTSIVTIYPCAPVRPQFLMQSF